MKCTSLEIAEKAIRIALSASSCMGFTLFGWFFLQLIMPVVTEEHLWICFVVSVAMTYVLQWLRGWIVVRLVILGDA